MEHSLFAELATFPIKNSYDSSKYAKLFIDFTKNHLDVIKTATTTVFVMFDWQLGKTMFELGLRFQLAILTFIYVHMSNMASSHGWRYNVISLSKPSICAQYLDLLSPDGVYTWLAHLLIWRINNKSYHIILYCQYKFSIKMHTTYRKHFP